MIFLLGAVIIGVLLTILIAVSSCGFHYEKTLMNTVTNSHKNSAQVVKKETPIESFLQEHE